MDPWGAAEELHDRGCIKRSKSYLYFHMSDQYHCMRTAEGEWAVDFIGRVDEPDDDWAEVRGQGGAGAPPAAAPAAEVSGMHGHQQRAALGVTQSQVVQPASSDSCYAPRSRLA